MNGLAAENLVWTCGDDGSGVLHNLHRQGGVPRASKVVGHHVPKLKRPGIWEHQVDVVRVVADAHHTQIGRAHDVVQVTNRMPVRAVRLKTNHWCERGHPRNDFRVEIDAPLKQRSVVSRPLVDDIERPDAVQRTPLKIAQVATGQIGSSWHGARCIRVVGVVQHPFGVHVPGIVEPFHVHNAQIVSTKVVRRASCRVWTSRSTIVHQQHFRPVGTRNPKAQITNEAVLNVGGDQLNVVAILQHLIGVEKVDEQLRGERHPCGIGKIGQL